MTRLAFNRILLAGASLVSYSAFAGPVEDSQKLIKDGRFDEAIALLEKADTKQPAIAKALVGAHMAKADFFLNNQEVPPMRKYPTALREYRKVLEYDKTNQKAQSNIKMIEDIYKQMGRDVPK